MRGRELKQLVKELKHESREYRESASTGLANAFKEKQITPQNINFTELFIDCFGYEAYEDYGASEDATFQTVKETAGAITTASFQNISQQFIAAIFMEAYDIPTQVFTKLIPTVPTKRRFERVVGVGHIGDEFDDIVDEGKEYALVGVSEDWRDTPQVRKRGKKAAITKEVIIFDETGLVVERVRMIGEWFGINQEKRAIDAVIDENTTHHRYNWQNTVYATYQTSTPWINSITSTPLVDYTSIDTARQRLMEITDPQTGEPQNVDIKDIIVPPSLQLAAQFAIGGVVTKSVGGFATSGNLNRTEIPNPIQSFIGGPPRIISSNLLNSRTAVDTGWYVGDIAKAVEWREVWPVTMVTMGAGTQKEFDQDIVQQFKASGMGAFSVKQPRKLLKLAA
jgi:hypothetical protein